MSEAPAFPFADPSLPLEARVEDESGDALSLAFIALGAPREIGARIFLVAFPRVALSREIFERNLALIASLPRRDATRVIVALAGAPAHPEVPDEQRRAVGDTDG